MKKKIKLIEKLKPTTYKGNSFGAIEFTAREVSELKDKVNEVIEIQNYILKELESRKDK